MSSVASDYQRLLGAQRELGSVPPELRRLRRFAAFLAFSPLALWTAYWIARVVIPDAFAQDYSGPMSLWTFVVIFAGSWQFTSTSRRLVGLRRATISAVLGMTVGAAFLYGYAATTSYAQAMPSVSERSFEIYRCHGRCRFGGYFVHQRANGTTVEGEYVGAPLPYGTTCTTVQRLKGDYGFSWVRVLERSPPPEHEVLWPIRRQDCFSDKPLATLRR
jgi:hypothetical protein